MACCLAIAFVFGVVRGVWFRVFPSRRPADPGFAPPALRLAPGPDRRSSFVERPARGPEHRGDTPLAAAARGIALGTLAYAVGTALLLVSGLAEATPGRSWMARDIALVALAGGAVAVALILYSPRPRHRAVVVSAVAATWVELGLLDMHLLGLFEFPRHPLLMDVVFHGSGFILLAIAMPTVLTSVTPSASRKAFAR